MALHLWVRFQKRVSGYDDVFIVLAHVAALGLVSQTTWAILVEDASERIATVPRSHLNSIIKVCYPLLLSIGLRADVCISL